jgi:hypothetical protein
MDLKEIRRRRTRFTCLKFIEEFSASMIRTY